MLAYLLRRLAFLLVSLVVAMIAIFVLLRLLPGDPANALLSVNATPEQIAAARAQVGSDQPLLQQFTTWAGQLLRFDLGESFLSSRPVGPDIADRLAVTLPLTLIAFGAALLVSLVIGITAAVKSDRWFGIALSGFAQLGVAVPVFWVGVVLVWVFALGLGALPSGGFPRDDWEDPADALRSLTLPVITIVIVMSASLSRYVRSATLDVLGSDYLRTARAGGSSMPEALLPLVSASGYGSQKRETSAISTMMPVSASPMSRVAFGRRRTGAGSVTSCSATRLIDSPRRSCAGADRSDAARCRRRTRRAARRGC